ncbi:hypothetical protein [Winogradskyella sp. MIT101101]|uniref:hypothetical protein n=1 Tax=Winogradskyella sp. MIT101101 TaxID=3098297 RepID=UPI00399B9889
MSNNLSHLKFSIIGGTISSTWIHITSEDIIKTILMAIIGAVVSYIVSILIKRIHQKFMMRKK